jgi:hypothetical protein
MKLKPAIMVCSIALLLGASGTLAQEAARAAKVDEILRLTKTDQIMQQMMTQMKTMSLQQLDKNLPPEKRAEAARNQQKVFDLLSEKLSWEKLKPAFIQIYSEVYTGEELDGILAFFRSPAGQAMVAKTPQLMSKSMALMQKLMADIQPEIEKLAQEPVGTEKK